MADSPTKIGVKGSTSPGAKHHFTDIEHIEHLLEHHKPFHISRDTVKETLYQIKEEYLNTSFGSTKTGTYKISRDPNVSPGIKKALENHVARLAKHKLSHTVKLDKLSTSDLKSVYEKLANLVAVTLTAHVFNAAKADMALTTLSNDIQTNDVSDLSCIFHLYTFLLSTEPKRHQTSGHVNLRHDVCSTIALLMDRYVDKKECSLR